MGVNLARSFTGPPNPPNEVPVGHPADLPRPTPGGLIMLAENTMYSIYGIIDIGSSCIEMAAGSVLQGRTYATAGLDVIRADNATCVVSQQFGPLLMDRLTVNQEGAGEGVYMDEPTSFHQMERAEVLGGGVRLVSGNFNASFVGFNGGGLMVDSTYSAPFGGIGIENCSFRHSVSGQVGLDIEAGASIGFINMLESAVTTTTGSFGIRVDTPGQVSLSARVKDGAFVGTGTALSGLDKTAATWTFDNQAGVADSRDHAVAGAVSILTTIDLDAGGTGEWVGLEDAGVLITYALDPGAERISLTDADTGELTIAGLPLDQKAYVVMLSATMERTAGQDIDVEIGVSINGADPTAGCSVRGVAATRQTQTTMSPCIVDMGFGDTIVPMIRNVDGSNPTNDVDVSSIKLVVAAS